VNNVNQQPAITAPGTASAAAGTAMQPITATATDADASNMLTISQVGMPFDLAFTTNSPGVSPRTAQISGTPRLQRCHGKPVHHSMDSERR